MSALVEVFDKAIKRLEVPGAWRQGDFGSPDCPQCAVGHLRTVTGYYDGGYDGADDDYNLRVSAVLLVEKVINEGSKIGLVMTFWNDIEGRTQEEVLAVFVKARELAVQKEVTS